MRKSSNSSESGGLKVLGREPSVDRDAHIGTWTRDHLGVHRLQMLCKYRMKSPDDEPPWKRLPETPVSGLWLTGMDIGFQDGVAQMAWTYEGMPTQSGGSSGTVSEVREMRTATQTEPITSHPSAGVYLSKYARRMENGEIIWKERMKGSKRRGFTKEGEGIADMNPLYGVRDYLAQSAVYTKRKVYPYDSLPSLTGFGAVVKNPEGAPDVGADYDWLFIGMRATQRGNVTEVEEQYLASGFGGWMKEIYEPLQEGREGQ
jgi:hypothetical protein